MTWLNQKATHLGSADVHAQGGVAGRAEQVATPSRVSQEMLVNAATARLLDSVGKPDPSSAKRGHPSRHSGEPTLSLSPGLTARFIPSEYIRSTRSSASSSSSECSMSRLSKMSRP